MRNSVVIVLLGIALTAGALAARADNADPVKNPSAEAPDDTQEKAR